jgi:hypothetical protein
MSLFWKYHIQDLKSKLNKACYAITSVMSSCTKDFDPSLLGRNTLLLAEYCTQHSFEMSGSDWPSNTASHSGRLESSAASL